MRFVALVLLAGCRQLLGFESVTPGDAAVAEDTSDSGGIDQQNIGCAGQPNGFLPATCLADPPGLLVLTGTIDTSTDARCDGSFAAVCLIPAQSISVSGQLITQGARPLVLWSATQIAVSGTIDASSHMGGTPGAGANDGICPIVDGAVSSTGSPVVGSGGGGGGYRAEGGGGGSGRNSAVVIANIASTPAHTFALHGGCPGGNGGGSVNSRGVSGGAVYLMAGESIMVTGVLTASGAAGRGGSGGGTLGGGGGGGSGGLIGFDAPVVTLDNSTVVTLGGGGGSGAGATLDGASGTEPSATGDPASGGNSTADFNAGGAGSNTDGDGGGNGSTIQPGNTGGGGGGGGGPGFILIFGGTVTTANAEIVPLPFINN